ncbi:hypothetical protein ASPWEDRAFT_117760 [Aspergillus wentii DTO 134E9]|uniref:Uncharacterized protein n=1 Tax=Aspergillus wentii DTO 134E9 TaxID=1073089 RepID=A0A1L9RBM0_ASPWE|nr:uncharacterized protein ASPWEDRAFT_117760 [Aspergillus wentii DTO 134E9]KAI9934880.1 hypothetical protein MW887_000501 [Aspergillus wentii]OJJ32322.1 hypothetical protein ASPWEDRAFT_117760 [Aspergillus wentii DTO 134E9]
MSSDDAYMAFLNKANADLNAGRSLQPEPTESAVRTETVDVGVRVPAPLSSVDAYYISETDEPFEPVVLNWEGAKRGIWPGSTQLSNLISPDADLSPSIDTMSPASFDPQNQYASVLRAVRAAVTQSAAGGIDESDVDVKVYRVQVGTSRAEYYVLGLDVEGGKIVGLKAKAVET